MSELIYEYEAGEEPAINIKDLQDEILELKEKNYFLEGELEVARVRVMHAERFQLQMAERAADLQKALDDLKEYTGVYKIPAPPLKTRPNAQRIGESY